MLADQTAYKWLSGFRRSFVCIRAEASIHGLVYLYVTTGKIHHMSYRDAEGEHTYRDTVHRLQLAIDSVKGRMRVDSHSRVVQWLDSLSRIASVDRRSVLEAMIPGLRQGRWDHPYRDSFRALVDSRMFIEIIEQLLPELNNRDIRDLISGNFDPALDKQSSRTRDREFELFIGAICRRSGMTVELREPDIVFQHNGSTRSIAAKRLSSPKQIESNIKKAAQQVKRAGLPGFIFLDVTRILDPACLIVTHWRKAHQTVGGHVLHFANTGYRETLRKKQNEQVLGIVLHTVFPHISRGFRYGTYETWWAVPVDEVDGQELDQLLDQFLNGSRNT